MYKSGAVPGKKSVSQRAQRRYAVLGLAAALMLCMGVTQAQGQRFETVIGGFVGDGLPATSANLVSPRGIAIDAAGNLYIAQEDENRIRKVSPNGIITTFAGNGAYGFGGDGGQASGATLAGPRGVAVDAAGNVYFSDAHNNRVRKISANGTITTVVGDGQIASSGDGGPALAASIRQPYGLAFDAAGNLYVAEWGGNRVRKVDTNGTITTVAGTGTAGFDGDGGAATAATLNQPMSLAFDSVGNLYISDSINNRVRRVSPGGDITTVVGGAEPGSGVPTSGSPATSVGLFLPYGISVDADDNLYVADNNCFIYKVVPSGILYRMAGGEGWCVTTGDGGPAIDANIFGAEGLAVAGNGDIYFTDYGSYIVRKISSGMIDTVAGVGNFAGDGGPATAAVLSDTQGVTIDSAGNLYVADSYPNGRIRKVAAGTGTIDTIAGNGSMSSTGDGGPAVNAGLILPRGVTLDGVGNLYVVDYVASRARKIDSNGIISTVAGTGTGFSGDGGPATSARLRRPSRMAIDAAGNLFIADYGNHRIRKVATDGTISTVVGNGIPAFGGDGGPATSAYLWNPTAVAFDAEGNLFIADNGNNRIRKVTPAGVISTVAGNGLYGPAGDGGPATDAALTGATGLAFDSQGSLYIAGIGLRKVATDGTISSLRGMKYKAYDVAIGPDDSVYVTVSSGRVLKSVAVAVKSDYDGDAVSDVFWRNAGTGANMYWPSANAASSQTAMAVPDQVWSVAGSGDFDADGHADLLWRNGVTGAVSLWKSANAATSQYLTTVSDLSWKIADIGDFDDDGRADILWRNTGTGANAIWRSGDSSTQLPIVAVTDQAWQIAGVGDFDADGRADIFWRNGATGANTIWKSADQSQAQNLAPVYNLALKIVGIGDFDGDGKSDALWRNASSGANAIWRSANPATIQSLPSVYDPAWQVFGTGDYNGDGQADILWRNTGNGAATVWKSANSATLQNVAPMTDPTWKIAD